MINQNAIIEWRKNAPWHESYLVEQDLIISRALTEIYNDKFLADRLAFRGGTALNKLYFTRPARYSEDLDFVQIKSEPIGTVLDRLKDVLSFLGAPRIKQKIHNNTLLFQFEAENSSGMKLKLKIEINTKEHFFVLDPAYIAYTVENQWFTSSCDVTTYCFDELIGTKIRALYQRKKGRDLFDLFLAIESGKLDIARAIECYRKYMTFSVDHVPTAKEYADNLYAKINDKVFRADITPILSPEQNYDQDLAYKIVSEQIVHAM